MTFTKADDNSYLTNRLTTHEVELGVHVSITGYVAKAKYTGSEFYDVDYDCGTDPEWARRVYAAVLTVLSARDSVEAFHKFPMQTKRPMSTDRVCFVNLLKLMKGVPPLAVTLDLDPIRESNIYNIMDMFK